MSGSAAALAEHPAEAAPKRVLITICCMAATLMQALDSTIANVALPYMQGSLGASADEITWVLTSYITAAAIMTAPVGWLAARFGRKNLMIVCLIGFTLTSMACGAAQSLTEMVVFRLLQGTFGAALVPLSQSTLMDIYPADKRGQAMAIWGVGVMLGPILGPTIGGYLTDLYNWRWVFYVNLPVGIAAVAGLIVFMPKENANSALRFDFIGFGVLAMGIGAFQLVLDRGHSQDWFFSTEILVECVLAALGIYLFVVHMLTAEKPFIPAALFRDRNFSAGLAMMFAVGVALVATAALMAPWLQTLANYPVAAAGLILSPRGIGTMLSMLLGGQLVTRMDPRLLIGAGLIGLSYSLWVMTTWTPDVSQFDIIATIFVQGFGLGLVFVPLQVVTFATLPGELRTDAASLMSLFRNVGSAVGVAVTSNALVRNAQIVHSQITETITPFNRALQAAHALDPTTSHGAALLDQIVSRQALIIAYIDDYKLMILTSLPALLLLPLMRRPARNVAADPGHAAMD